MSPLLNFDKQHLNLNNNKESIKDESSKDVITKLPSILNSLSARAREKKKLSSSKSTKNINLLNPEIKPKNLFFNEGKNNHLNQFKYHLERLKKNNFINRKKNSSIKRNSFNSDLNMEVNSVNKFDISLEKNFKNLKEKTKKYRLFSSIEINPNKNFLKKISFFSPRIAGAVINNYEKIKNSFMH